jgi:hypothetical protein
VDIIERLRDGRYIGQEGMREEAAAEIVKLRQQATDNAYGWDSEHRLNELLRAALKEAVTYADAASREEGMPEDKQCKRLTVQEVQLVGKPTSRNSTTEWDVAAARKLLAG